MGAARSIGSAKLVIRHVVVPLKVFTAASANRVSFNRLHVGCGGRVTQGLRCASENVGIAWEDLVTAFEYEPDKFVRFPADELKAIEASLDADTIELSEFVPLASIDPIALDKAYLVGPDKGCASTYRVISEALRRRRLAGVGFWGKDLAVIRAQGEGLVVHTAYFAKEVRSLGDILEEPPAPPLAHVKLAENLFTLMGRDSFDASRFRDRYAEKIADAVKRKVDGEAVIIPPPKAGARQPLGLAEALERSLAGAGPAKARTRRSGKAA